MVEFGHYQELSWILDRVNGAKGAEFRQTFVFSATLTLPRRSSEKKVKVRRRKNLSSQESIGEEEGARRRVVPHDSLPPSSPPSPSPSLSLPLSLLPSLFLSLSLSLLLSFPPSPSLSLSLLPSFPPSLPLPPPLFPSLSLLPSSPPSPSSDNLISQVGLRENAAVVDLSRHGGTVETLTETRIMCTAKDKVTVFLPSLPPSLH